MSSRSAIVVPAGTSAADFRLAWRENWGQYPTNDIDLYPRAAERYGRRSGATLNSPERVVVNGARPGNWLVVIAGFEVAGRGDKIRASGRARRKDRQEVELNHEGDAMAKKARKRKAKPQPRKPKAKKAPAKRRRQTQRRNVSVGRNVGRQRLDLRQRRRRPGSRATSQQGIQRRCDDSRRAVSGPPRATTIACGCANTIPANLGRTLQDLGVASGPFQVCVFNAVTAAGYSIAPGAIPAIRTRCW